MTRPYRIATMLVLGSACLVGGYLVLRMTVWSPPPLLVLTNVSLGKDAEREPGFQRLAAQLTVPENHKLSIFYRVYLGGKLEKQRSWEVKFQDTRRRTELISVGMYDPDKVSHEPSKKIKLLCPGGLPDQWVEVENKSIKSIGGRWPLRPIGAGELVTVYTIEVGHMLPDDQTPRYLLQVKVPVLVEPLSADELSSIKLNGRTRSVSTIDDDSPSGGK